MGNKIPWTKNHISTVADADGVLCVWTRAEQKVPKNIYIKKIQMNECTWQTKKAFQWNKINAQQWHMRREAREKRMAGEPVNERRRKKNHAVNWCTGK